MNPARRLAGTGAIALIAGTALAAGPAPAGRELVEASLRRHAPPAHVYEELTMVLTDAAGHRQVRHARQYLRGDPAGSQERVLEIHLPADLRGATLRLRSAVGALPRVRLELPAARGPRLYEAGPAERVFGSDFTAADFLPERTRDFAYEREADRTLERVPHYSVRARVRDEAAARRPGIAERRLFLRKDNLFVSRIDYLDRHGTLRRQQTFRDPQPDGEGAVRAGMVLMESLQERHSTLLKVERRVHSADFVPAERFAEAGR